MDRIADRHVGALSAVGVKRLTPRTAHRGTPGTRETVNASPQRRRSTHRSTCQASRGTCPALNPGADRARMAPIDGSAA